jgi:hypothetical protein
VGTGQWFGGFYYRPPTWLMHNDLAWLVLFLIMLYIGAVLFNEIACFLGDQLRNFLTCEPYQNFS